MTMESIIMIIKWMDAVFVASSFDCMNCRLVGWLQSRAKVGRLLFNVSQFATSETRGRLFHVNLPIYQQNDAEGGKQEIRAFCNVNNRMTNATSHKQLLDASSPRIARNKCCFFLKINLNVSPRLIPACEQPSRQRKVSRIVRRNLIKNGVDNCIAWRSNGKKVRMTVWMKRELRWSVLNAWMGAGWSKVLHLLEPSHDRWHCHFRKEFFRGPG